jgi:predicted lipid-binding transport protein (Tim44 family)
MIPAGSVWTGTGSRPNGNGATPGGRGSRSASAAARRVPDRPEPLSPRVIVPQAPPARRSGPWVGTLVVISGGLIAGSLVGGFGRGLGGMAVGLLDVLLGGIGIVVVLMLLRRRHAARAQARRAAPPVASSVDMPRDRPATRDHLSGGASFDRGLRDIRRTDPGFDPDRFAGYTGMVFRDAQGAWMTRDIGSLRDRVTPDLYGQLQAQCDGLRDAGQANHLERIDITAVITEAWQESGRDYVTACIGGSIVDYTVDAMNDRLLHGSRTIPREIEEFWTFTRPAGLNFWMLSAIHSS